MAGKLSKYIRVIKRRKGEGRREGRRKKEKRKEGRKERRLSCGLVGQQKHSEAYYSF